MDSSKLSVPSCRPSSASIHAAMSVYAACQSYGGLGKLPMPNAVWHLSIVLPVQMAMPLAMLGSLHFDLITDLAWSTDGRLLAVSSYDGFCR